MTGQGGARSPAGPTSRGDPFAVMGLDRDADLTDDDVRAAWRRIAAATHPDRADGGDPGRFAAAAAAYTELRTGYGRGEARAGLADGRGGLVRRAAVRRSTRMALRAVAAAAAAVLALRWSWPGPAGPALATGAGTWLVLTSLRGRW